MSNSQHDFKAALVDMGRIKAMTFDDTKHADYVFGQTLAFHFEAIRFALRFTEKMMQEPSLSMHGAAAKAHTVGDMFKALRDQAVKEIEEDETTITG